MKCNILRSILVAISVAAILSANLMVADAAVTDLPLITVKGEKCYYYDVQPKESIYQVANKLGITRERVVQFNPSASDGLKPRMRLYFPVKDFVDQAAGSRRAVYAAAAGVHQHVVKKGETLYGIARQYGMSPDVLAKLNPQAADGMRVGDIIVINEGSADAPAPAKATVVVSEKSSDGVIRHEIKKGETLFGIASAYNVPLESVLEANPKIDPMRYRPGQVLVIPSQEATMPAPESTIEALAAASVEAEQLSEQCKPVADTAPAEEAPDADEGYFDFSDTADGYDAAETDEEIRLDVAVMLPFMLAEAEMSRATQLYTEFFKGMLLGADSLTDSPGTPVRLHFYDTSANTDTVRAVLSQPEFADMDLVVGPDDADHLQMILQTVDEDVPVLNIFAVKDESYRDYRNMVQTNIPHANMYSKAIDRFCQDYADALPVFISRTGGLADKEAFTSALKHQLDSLGREYREILYHTSLSDDDLEGLDPMAKTVVFVPASGSKTEFTKYVSALTRLRKNNGDANVTIFGYPEWVTFRGESFNEICELGATIYSRFMANEADAATRRVKQQYKEAYGTEMSEAVPAQGILGYDVATFVINGLRTKERTGIFPTLQEGIQSSWALQWSGVSSTDADTGETESNGGLVNDALYFINYRPSGVVDWTRR